MSLKNDKRPAGEPGREDVKDFERSLEELQQIVEDLETGRLSLSDSLTRYDRGVELLKGCYRTLEASARRVEIVSFGPGPREANEA